MANFIACASAFTARSLIDAGCQPSKITVIPYGIDPAMACVDEPPRSRRGPCRFLFVGQGIQRKGLHHLLTAWNKAALQDAELTVIASTLDPGIARLAGRNVKILGRQSSFELRRHFSSSNVFVLPSLVEGFGLVLLEALAAGCYCIGTNNTGLPDLNCPTGVASVFSAGDIEMLHHSIVSAYGLHCRREIDHDAIREFARALSWTRFRTSIANLAEAHLPSRQE
jgi:glycosyltransferase involved in cell wall biosynthesis